MYEPSAIAGLVVAAVLTAGLYALMSYGLALVYGVMKIINLAHAGTMMLGAFDDILDTRERAYKQRLPQIDSSLARVDLDAMLARRVDLESRLKQIER